MAEVTSSEPVDPDDTTISSSNLGPREISDLVTKSGDIDYLVDSSSVLDIHRPAADPGQSASLGNYNGRPRNSINASIWLS